MSLTPNTSPQTRRANLAIALTAAAVVSLAAYRASIGQSFYDDTFYAVVPWRFAHGARFLADELSLQTVGEMVSVPFAWLWERAFGTTGIVLAIRLLWIALATAGAAVSIRLLRGVAPFGVVALAVALPLLAPPYHVFAPTYNTVSSLLLTLAVLLGFAAVRFRRASAAVWMGAALALGGAAYPPLAPAAVVLLATFVVLAREWRLAWRAIASATAVGALVAATLFARVSPADIGLALSLGNANVGGLGSPLGRLSWTLGNTATALISPWLAPMWALAIAASITRVPGRMRAVALALVPVAAALPGASLLLRGDHLAFGTSVQSWLITLCAGAIVPSVLAARRLGRGDLLRLLALAAPFSAVGYATVAYVTNSSWNRGMPEIALAPLVVGITLCWGVAIAEERPGLFSAGAGATLLIAFALLYSSVFGDNSFWQPQTRIAHGAYAGLLTSPEHARNVDSLTSSAARWVRPGASVTFLGQAEGYLATPGTPLTPTAWLFVGPADSVALGYYRRVGRMPDAVFVSDADVEYEGGYATAPARDPMLRWTLANYRRVDRAGGFSVFIRR